MIEWLKRLFHFHEWNIIQQGRITCDGDYVGEYFYMKCSVCGKIKKKELKPWWM